LRYILQHFGHGQIDVRSRVALTSTYSANLCRVTEGLTYSWSVRAAVDCVVDCTGGRLAALLHAVCVSPNGSAVNARGCVMPRRAVHSLYGLVVSWERCSEWRGRNVRNLGFRTCFLPLMLPRSPSKLTLRNSRGLRRSMRNRLRGTLATIEARMGRHRSST
jgi:hypothetical protein